VFEIGTSLREARLRQGLDFPALEESTKIRSKYLRALEEERFDLLPAETYVKGFLRTYAEQLGLDGQLYVDEYNSRYVTGEEEPPLRARRSAPSTNRSVESRGILLALGAIVSVTALVIAAWKFGDPGANTDSIRNLSPAAGSKRSPSRPARKPVRKRRATTVPTAKLLVRAVYGDSWLQVKQGSATGKQLFAGTLETGSTMGFERRRLWVTIGRPGNVLVRLNGRVQQVASLDAPAVLVVTARGIRPAA
jgi:cytoskeleton protein RodZ